MPIGVGRPYLMHEHTGVGVGTQLQSVFHDSNCLVAL